MFTLSILSVLFLLVMCAECRDTMPANYETFSSRHINSIFTRPEYSFSHRQTAAIAWQLLSSISLSVDIMFSRFARPVSSASRQFSTSGVAQRNVAVMGASGGERQSFVLLWERCHVTKLWRLNTLMSPQCQSLDSMLWNISDCPLASQLLCYVLTLALQLQWETIYLSLF